MNDDTRGMIYGTLVVFLLFLVGWLGFRLYFGMWFHIDLYSGRSAGCTDSDAYVNSCPSVTGSARGNSS